MRNQPDAALPQHPEGLHPVRQRWEHSRWTGNRPASASAGANTCAPTSGQLSQVGRQFYNTDIEVEILSKEETEKMTYVVRSHDAPTRFMVLRLLQSCDLPGDVVTLVRSRCTR